MNTRHKRGDVTKDVAALAAAHPDMPTKQVAEQIGTSYTAAYSAFNRLGLTPVKMKTRKKKATHEINGVKMSKLKHGRIESLRAQLPQLDERERLGAEDIAARIGVTGSCIREWLRILKHRLNNNNGRTIYKHDHIGWEEKILPVYAANNYNASKTADDLGMDKSVCYRWLANNGHIKRKHAERDISKFKFQNYR